MLPAGDEETLMDGILEEKWSGVSSHWKFDVIPYSRLVRNGGECREIFGVSMKQAIHVPGIYTLIFQFPILCGTRCLVT